MTASRAGSNKRRLWSLAMAAMLGMLPIVAKASPPIDVDLVIAIDVSVSMDRPEKALQRDGFAAAFRNAEILQAIASGAHQRIAVTVMEWGGANDQVVIVPRMLVDGSTSAAALANQIEARPPGRSLRGTAIGDALIRAASLFGPGDSDDVRRVVDVSGDGVSNAGRSLDLARRELTERGVTINALAIAWQGTMEGMAPTGHPVAQSPLGLIDYFNEEVIGGPGAFVMPVMSTAGFAEAIRRKLIREIRGTNTIAMGDTPR